MPFVRVYEWPAYLKTEGEDPTVLRLVLIYGYNKGVYRRDAGDWTITVQHDQEGAITTAYNEYINHDGQKVTMCKEGVPMYAATWEEHKKSNAGYERRCECPRIRPPA